MGLTWRDGVATLFMGAIAAVYVAFLNGTDAWLISSARGTTTAVLVLGIVGGCALSAVGEVYTAGRSRGGRAYRALATTCGVIALAAGVTGLITGGTVPLAVLVAATFALWLIATIRHALTAPAGPAGGRDTHEVLHPEGVARH